MSSIFQEILLFNQESFSQHSYEEPNISIEFLFGWKHIQQIYINYKSINDVYCVVCFVFFSFMVCSLVYTETEWGYYCNSVYSYFSKYKHCTRVSFIIRFIALLINSRFVILMHACLTCLLTFFYFSFSSARSTSFLVLSLLFSCKILCLLEPMITNIYKMQTKQYNTVD